MLNKPMSLLHDGVDRSRRLEQAVTALIGLFVFLTPFPHTTAIKEMTFYVSLAGMLYLAFSKKRVFSWSTPLTMPFALLAAWSAVGLLFALDRPNTFHDIVTHLLKYYAVYFLVVQFYPSQKGFDTLARIIVASTALFSVGAIVYYYPVLGHSFSERLGHSEQLQFLRNVRQLHGVRHCFRRPAFHEPVFQRGPRGAEGPARPVLHRYCHSHPLDADERGRHCARLSP